MNKGDTVWTISSSCGDCDYKNENWSCIINSHGGSECYHVTKKLYHPEHGDILGENVFFFKKEAEEYLKEFLKEYHKFKEED